MKKWRLGTLRHLPKVTFASNSTACDANPWTTGFPGKWGQGIKRRGCWEELWYESRHHEATHRHCAVRQATSPKFHFIFYKIGSKKIENLLTEEEGSKKNWVLGLGRPELSFWLYSVEGRAQHRRWESGWAPSCHGNKQHPSPGGVREQSVLSHFCSCPSWLGWSSASYPLTPRLPGQPPSGMLVWSQHRESGQLYSGWPGFYRRWHSSLCSRSVVQNKSRITPDSKRARVWLFHVSRRRENWKHGSHLSSRIPVWPWKSPLWPLVLSFPLCKMRLIAQNSWKIECHPWGKRSSYEAQSQYWSKWFFLLFIAPSSFLPLFFFSFPFYQQWRACFVWSPPSKKQFPIGPPLPQAHGFCVVRWSIFIYPAGTRPKNRWSTGHPR